MWGQAGDLHFNIPEITIQRGDSGQMSRKRPKSLEERKKQEKLERGRYMANQRGNKKGKWNEQKCKAKKQEACKECTGNKVFWEQGQN